MRISEMLKKTLFIFCALFVSGITYSQTIHRSIEWQDPYIKKIFDEDNVSLYKVLKFKNAAYSDPQYPIPVYYERIAIGDMEVLPKIKILNYEYEDIPQEQVDIISDISIFGEDIKYKTLLSYIEKKPYLELFFYPFIIEDGNLKRITDFSFILEQGTERISVKKGTYKSSSLLSTGKWYKIKVSDDGIYTLTYTDLENMGFTNPQNARLYGYGAGMLPELPGHRKYDDLVEIPLIHYNNSIIFYLEGPHKWTYGNNFFYHSMHLYSDYMYYFITTDITSGNSIVNLSGGGVANQQVTSFDDYDFYEPEYVNLLRSGKEWYGNPMSFNLYEYFSLYKKNILRDEPVKMRFNAIARTYYSTNISVTCNNDSLGLISILGLGGNLGSVTGAYANGGNALFSYSTHSDSLNIELKFNKRANYTEEAWFDYVILNARRKLKLEGNDLIFRDVNSVGIGNISKFQLDNATENTLVWDVTDIHNIKSISAALTGSKLEFIVPTDSLRTFVAFNKVSQLQKPYTQGDDLGIIEKQDLHGMSVPNYVILTPKEFVNEANDLADFHRTHNDIDVMVVILDDIYNEFSSGTPDITAIRDFMKFLYDRDDNALKYLLLFGDGNYDNKTRPPLNPNFIPTYQSNESLVQSNTIVTDDYYGILGYDENYLDGKLDIGVGRFTIQNATEAQDMVKKVKIYISNSSRGPWRNTLTFIGDDQDGNLHMNQANSLASYLNANYPFFNTERILLDTYKQVAGATGASYPAVTEAINNRLKIGGLFMNYTGHGSEQGLAHEKILTKQDISNWYNPEIFPIFFTATCEFSRFDDIIIEGRTKFVSSPTAGELVVLNSHGGGIASFTTNRLVYASDNYRLNERFYAVAFTKNEHNEAQRFGDLIRMSKEASADNLNKRKFCLLGDPAIKVPCPKHRLIVDSINNVAVGGFEDTLNVFSDTVKALDLVQISGHIQSEEGVFLNEFNGIIYATIFDKPNALTTLVNDNDSKKATYYSQTNILFKGRAAVNNGTFSFSFIVPKDINYLSGNGKISLYALNEDEDEDATGYYNKISIGGFNSYAENDMNGPEIKLYMNDSGFINGGITDENPDLYARIFDEKGINTSSSGIGHSITAIIDGDQRNPIVLNEYFLSDINSYKEGSVTYPLYSLSEGQHSLRVKVWDVYNNSSEATIDFFVADALDLKISRLINYPNPVSDNGTAFYFEHNQNDAALEVTLQIFSMNGDLVKVIEYNTVPSGYKEGPIQWDGKDINGNPLNNGIYIYRVLVKSSTGDVVQKSDKLLILR
ncbi:MAG: type IX secretion system sortase PorU [Bacteroidales bacterium]|nr:type IX secretion system sortase PorU [Bacteroidales bacterium]